MAGPIGKWRKIYAEQMDKAMVGFGVGNNGVYSQGEAWIWMLMAARYEPYLLHDTAGNVMWLQPGQFSHSTRFMAKAWNWSQKRVANFLKKLELIGLIQIDSRGDSGLVPRTESVVTICKFEDYQGILKGPDSLNDSLNDSSSASNKKNLRTKELKKKDSLPEAVAVATHQLSVWITKNAPRVNKMDSPLTNEQCEQLVAKYTKEQLKEVLIEMDNWKPLLRKNKSAFHTLNKWMGLREERNGKPKAVYTKYQPR